MVVCPGRGILAQHQHQGSNQEEFSEGHFETKNYPQIKFIADDSTVVYLR